MTINQAIERTDSLKYNDSSRAEKIAWLSQLDGMIQNKILDTHQGAAGTRFTGYDMDTDGATVLLVSAPYDAMYLRWLEAQIDYANGEIDRYNASITMFNTEYEAFENFYIRTHMPIPAGNRFLF